MYTGDFIQDQKNKVAWMRYDAELIEWRIEMSEYLVEEMETYPVDAWKAVEHLNYDWNYNSLILRLKNEGMTEEEESGLKFILSQRPVCPDQ